MRPDQLQRLQDLSEKLADTFLTEADPGEWPGGSLGPADLSQQERGDRYWCKKNAMATGGVLRFALDLMKHRGAGEDPEEEDHDMDRRIRDAERRAEAAVKKAISRAKHDGKAHQGKP